MPKAVAWTFALYAVLKLCHLVLGRSRRPDGEPLPLSTRLRAGEPKLLIGTVTVAGLLLGYTSWWSHTFAAGHYASATACYPKLAAARYLPAAPARFGSYDAAEAVGQLRHAAEEHGAVLGIDRGRVDRSLDASRIAYARRYAALAAKNDRRAIAAAVAELDRCLRGEHAPRGEIFNP